MEYSAYLTVAGELVTSVNDQEFGTEEAIKEAEESAGEALAGTAVEGPTARQIKALAAKKEAKAQAAVERVERNEGGGVEPSDISSASGIASAATGGNTISWSKATKCADTSYALIADHPKSGTNAGGYQNVRWYYNPANQPSTYTDAAYKNRLTGAADTWDVLWNNCGIETPLPNYFMDYGGTTSAAANCSSSVPVNVAGWATLSKVDTVAETCSFWWANGDTRFIMRFNLSRLFYAAASESGCSAGRFDLEAIANHEFGHALGLDHVAQSTSLVMRPTSGACEMYHRYLGRGDIRGVKAKYGSGFWGQNSAHP